MQNAGAIVQVVYTLYTTYASGSTIWPLDDTIPQNTDGDEFITRAITPTNASNILMIEAVVCAGRVSSTTGAGCGIFQDSTAACLNSGTIVSSSVGNGGIPMVLRHFMAAGTTSSTTFKLRAGDEQASNFKMNGTNTRMYGGTMTSSLTITEIAV